MSRSGYSYDFDDDYTMHLYRGQVASATRGKRGQALLKDILIAMNGMSSKRLIADDLETPDGAVCAIGAAGKLRGVNMSGISPDDTETVAWKFNISDCLAREIVWENDDCGRRNETSEERFVRMRKWVRRQIKDPLFDVVWC